ncbi:MAG: hypothetical protein Q7S84_02755 [bacterium]|nr:hypothetical protein [bacterium]
MREVSKSLPANYRTTSEHLRRTMLTGLVRKHNAGKRVEHELTPLGKRTLAFLRTLERER